MGARAYTVGPDVFGAGHYSPGSTAGRLLSAHELTHVLQQSRPPSPAAGAPVRHRSPEPALMRSPIFPSTMKICRRVLESRGFAITQGGLIVTTNASWEPSD